MTAPSLDVLTGSDRLAPLLPLLHAAWDDGELESEELTTLRDHLLVVGDLDESERSVVAAWLDPSSKPSAEELARLAAHIRRRVDTKTIPSRPSELGLRLTGAVDDATADSLRAAEVAAGGFTPALAAHIVHPDLGVTLAPLPEPGPTPPWATSLADLLDGPAADTKARVRQILSRPEFAPAPGLPTDEYRELVLGWTRTLAFEGIGALGYPTDVGGADDPGAFIAAFTTLGHHDPSLLTKFGVQFGLFGGAIQRLGTRRHHELLADVATLDLPGCFAMSETGHGSNVAGLETTATYDVRSQEFEIHTPDELARKDWIGNAALHGQMAVVFAQLRIGDLEHGVHAFLVPIRDDAGRVLPGRDISDVGPKGGLDGVDNGRIAFDRVRIPRAAMLDRFAGVSADGTYTSPISSPTRRFFTTLGTLVGGRVSVASAAISAAETGLAIAVRYATRRRQFGTHVDGGEIPLIEYRTHQRRLLPPLARTIGFHVACARLTEQYVASERAGETDRRSLEAKAAGLKAFATWHAIDALQTAREACGGQGYLAINRIAPLRADADVFTTYEGDNTVLAQLVARALLTEYRASFEELGFLRTAQLVGSRIVARVAESVPRVGEVSGDLLSSETQVELMERRETHVLETLADRIRRRIADGMDPTVAFLDVQPHAVSAARAHVERLVVEHLIESLADLEGSETLEQVRSLAALSMAEADLAWFLEHGVLGAGAAGSVRRHVTELSAALAPMARYLVDAFRIPDEVLAAPIAQ